MDQFTKIKEATLMENSNPHQGVKCLDCKNEIFSENRHDFKYCSCGKVFVDGGKDYLRFGWDDTKPQIISRATKEE